MLVRQARSFGLQKLKNIYHQLTKIDLQIKTGKIPMSTGDDELLHLKIDQLLCSNDE
jgi:DNA polymerase III delta subunit